MFGRGGKLPGLCGAECVTGCDPADGLTGWSARHMWIECAPPLPCVCMDLHRTFFCNSLHVHSVLLKCQGLHTVYQRRNVICTVCSHVSCLWPGSMFRG